MTAKKPKRREARFTLKDIVEALLDVCVVWHSIEDAKNVLRRIASRKKRVKKKPLIQQFKDGIAAKKRMGL